MTCSRRLLRISRQTEETGTDFPNFLSFKKSVMERTVPGFVDDRDVGERGDQPKHGRHAIEERPDDDQDNALRALQETHLAGRDQVFGAGARVTDHDGANHGDGDQRHVEVAVDAAVISEQPDQEAEVGVAIHDRVVEAAEGSDAINQARHAAVSHIKNSGQDNRGAGPTEISVREQVRGQAIDDETDEGEEVWVDARRAKSPNNGVQDVPKRVADFSGHHEESPRARAAGARTRGDHSTPVRG